MCHGNSFPAPLALIWYLKYLQEEKYVTFIQNTTAQHVGPKSPIIIQMISGYYKDHNISITAFLHLLKNNSVPRGLRMRLLSCTCPIKLTIFNYRIKMHSQIDLVLIGFFLYKSCTLQSCCLCAIYISTVTSFGHCARCSQHSGFGYYLRGYLNLFCLGSVSFCFI